MNEGYIKLYRCMSEWEWYTDIPTKSLFLHCLIKANWKDRRFQGYEVPRGAFVTSLKNLSTESGLTVMQVRRSLKKLELSGEISKKATNHFTLIKVLKYRDYQTSDDDVQQTDNKRITNKQQTDNNNRRSKEYKKERIYRPSQSNVPERNYSDEMLEGLYKNMEDEQ